MKKSFIVFLLIMGTIVASAQDLSKGITAGVRVQWDYSIPATNLVGVDSGSGVSAGILCDIPIYRGLFFEPGVGFFYDTMDYNFFDIFFDGKPVGPNGTLRNYGFRAPLLFGYRFDLVDDVAISVITGPQLSYGLSAKAHYDNDNIKDINLYHNDWHRWDVAWAVGLKLHYLDNFFAELSASFGMSNILGQSDYSGMHLRRNMVNVGVGYSF